MNSRVLDVIAGPVDRWAQAGDQLYADLDLSHDNLPEGSRLAVGEAQLEVTGVPHTGCGKFVKRFGLDAMRWVNSDTGMSLRLRGVNTRVVKPGAIRVGDRITKADEGSGYTDWSGGEPRVDAYIQESKRWPAEITALRPVLLSTGLTEELKWRSPCYSHDGKNIVIIQEMNDHLALMFFKGALLADPAACS